MAAPIITAFTPSVLDVETLKAIFVSRQPLLDDLVEGVASDVETGSRTHRLLIGPRGIGKTHLVTLLDDRLRNDDRLMGKVVVAWLREELWEVDTYLAWLEAVLGALAAEEPSIRDDLARIGALPADEAERAAEEVLWQRVGDRLLVVISENFDLLLENLARSGQAQLRASMENHRGLTLIATTSSMPADLYDSDAPFYGWFRPSYLDEFSIDEARELLIKVAHLRGDAALVEYLASDEADGRLRVVTELAGGSPRIWVLLSQCIDVESIEKLIPVFIKMLDDLTPFYQERLRQLAPQQRRIVMELARRGGGVPVKELASGIRADQRTVSSQLRGLERRNLVRRVEPVGRGSAGDARLSYYELREPLMRLALDVKESRGEPLRVVVAFLRAWYGNDLVALAPLFPPVSLSGTYVGAALRALVEKSSESETEVGLVLSMVTAGDARRLLHYAENQLRDNGPKGLAEFARAWSLAVLGRVDEAVTAANASEATEPGLLDPSSIKGLAETFAESHAIFRSVIEEATTDEKISQLSKGLLLGVKSLGVSEGTLDRAELMLYRNLLMTYADEIPWVRPAVRIAVAILGQANGGRADLLMRLTSEERSVAIELLDTADLAKGSNANSPAEPADS
jgi:hypothetical protein